MVSNKILNQKVTELFVRRFTKSGLEKDIFLVIDTTLVSDNPLRFKLNLIERI